MNVVSCLQLTLLLCCGQFGAAFIFNSALPHWFAHHHTRPTHQTHPTHSTSTTQQPQAEIGADFDETKKRTGYEFIYHEDNDLLLMLHEDRCYFYRVSAHDAHHLQSHHYRPRVETSMASAAATFQEMEEHHHHQEHQLDHYHVTINDYSFFRSSLAEARDLFSDRLADYHCLDKLVYLMHAEDAD